MSYNVAARNGHLLLCLTWTILIATGGIGFIPAAVVSAGGAAIHEKWRRDEVARLEASKEKRQLDASRW